MEFDVIIIGAGPAGTACAKTFIDNKSSLKILLIEKETFPRDKVCGDALTYSALPLIKEIFPELLNSIPSRSSSRKYRIYYEGGNTLQHQGEFDVIPRKILDNLLFETIKNQNISIQQNCYVKDISLNENSNEVLCVKDNEPIIYKAKWILAADGSNSVVKRKTGPLEHDEKTGAVRQYVKGLKSHHDELLFFLDMKHHGYFWIFPFLSNDEYWANIGCGSFIKTDFNPHKQFKYFMNNQYIQSYMDEAQYIDKPVGFPLDLADTKNCRLKLHQPIAGNGYLLLGDAAGLVHPYTGEGISTALFSGRLAAQLLLDNNDRQEIVRSYEKRLLKHLHKSYRLRTTSLLLNVPRMLPKPFLSPYLETINLLQTFRTRATAHVTPNPSP